MQKKLIALAVAGLVAAPAFAQSNVTIYGIADVGFVHANGSGMKKNAIDSGLFSGSRIGFKGTEDLGNGLKALFTLEYKINPDNDGSVGDGSRQTFIGLTGSFGTVVAGRLQPMAKTFVDTFDPIASTSFSPTYDLHEGTIHTGIRLNNAVAYVTPGMSGFTGQVAYSFGGAAAGDGAYSNDQERILGLAGMYSNGPIGAGVVYHRVTNVGNVSSADSKDWALGGSYDFGVVKLMGLYNRHKNDANNNTDKTWTLGGQVPVGAADTIYVGYTKLKADGSDMDAKGWALQYSHNMSKRTMLYAGYSRISNDDAATKAVSGITAAAGDSSTRFGVGMRHTF